ncbi:MAG: signal peptidase II [Chloroflexota bacterium]|nr:signal peptidase II [Chloroflexota bacterium]
MTAKADSAGPSHPGETTGAQPPSRIADERRHGEEAGTGTSGQSLPASGRASAWDSAEVRYGFLAAVAAVTLAADQATKSIVQATMQLGEVIPVIPPVLDLHYITNSGVAFGLFPRFGDVFIPIALVIMTIIVAYYRSLRHRRLWLRTALALQLGGALGNLIDRLRYGAVVDFVEFHIDAINFHWPVFNVADSAIVVGVGILLVCMTTQAEE